MFYRQPRLRDAIYSYPKRIFLSVLIIVVVQQNSCKNTFTVASEELPATPTSAGSNDSLADSPEGDSAAHESLETVEFRPFKDPALTVEHVRLNRPSSIRGQKVIQSSYVPVAVPKICEFPPLLANDCMSELRWYYSTQFKCCLPFQSGSECDSNGNNFPTKAICQEVCKTTMFVELEMGTMSSLRCGAPTIDTHHCKPDYWPDRRFYYDDTLNRCVPFDAKGCAASNSFASVEDCTFFCRQPDVFLEKVPTVACFLPKVRGFEVCFNGQTRWFYNAEKKRCEWFMYSGCFGNWNNFVSYTDCEAVCKSTDSDLKVCGLPSDVGTSFQFRLRYFYDQASNSCKSMKYSGFGGNANNFFLPEECESQCVVRPES